MTSWVVIEILRKSDYRDMEKYKKTKREQQKRYYHKTQDAPNKRKYWTDEETELVMKHEISDTELSKMLGRSVKAIQRRRHRFLYGE